MWNLPNALSCSRVLLLAMIIAADHQLVTWIACLSLLLAVLTDLVDGPLARRTDTATPRGTLVDHGCDAIFVAGLNAWLAWNGVLSGWLSPLIVIAFIQYLLDAAWLKQPGSRPSKLGKLNGIGYYVVSIAGYLALRVFSWHWLLETVQLIAWLLIATTLMSIIARMRFTFEHRNSNA